MKKCYIPILLPLFFFCAGSQNSNTSLAQEYVHKTLTQSEINGIMQKVKNLPTELVEEDETAILETTKGTIEFKFYPKDAPGHCANFKKLANSGFYDGTTFHRVIPNFMIQGGDILSRDSNPSNDGTGHPGYRIKAEFNSIPHERGIVSMARSRAPDTAGSQFFICVARASSLDGQYTVFGKVTKGMDVVDKIVNAKRDERDRPLENIRIIKARVVKK